MNRAGHLPRLLEEVLHFLPGAISVAEYIRGEGYQYGKIYDSPGVAELFGLEKTGQERSRGSILALVHPEDRSRFVEAARRAGEEQCELEIRFRIRHGRTGEERWILERARGIPGDAPDHTIVIALFVDDTEHLTSYEALRLSEATMRALVEGSQTLFFYLQDADGNVRYVSPSVETITGYDPERWKGQNHWFTTDNPINDAARERTHRHLAGERTEGPFKVEILHASGRPILLEVIEEPVVQDAKPLGIRGLARDITREYELEEQLAEARRMESVGRLAAGLAHDLNNLFQGIVSAAELARLKAGDSDAAGKWLERILELTAEGRKLLSNILSYSKRQLLRKARVDFNQVVRDAADLARTVLGRNVALEAHYWHEPLPVIVDSARITGVLLALAETARASMTGGGTFGLATLRRGDLAILEVTENSSSAGETGTATGGPDETLELAGVRGTIEQHGGTIEGTSLPGAGSRFTIALPLAETDENGSRPGESAASVAGAAPRLLFVDDNALFAEAIVPILETSGFHVTLAGTLDEARRVLATDPGIAVVVSDLNLPDGSGAQLTAETDKPVILMSGYALGSLPPGTASLPEHIIFLEKPFSVNRLLEAIRSVCSSP